MPSNKNNDFDELDDLFFQQGEQGAFVPPAGPDPAEEARRAAEEEARRAEEERVRQEAEASRRAEEARRAEEERRRREEEARRAEEERRRREEEARRAEEERRRREEEARRAEEERRRREEEARRAEEARRRAEEEARRAEEARRRAEEEARRAAEEEARRRAEADLEDSFFGTDEFSDELRPAAPRPAPVTLPTEPAPRDNKPAPPTVVHAPTPVSPALNSAPTLFVPLEELRAQLLAEEEAAEASAEEEEDELVATAESFVDEEPDSGAATVAALAGLTQMGVVEPRGAADLGLDALEAPLKGALPVAAAQEPVPAQDPTEDTAVIAPPAAPSAAATQAAEVGEEAPVAVEPVAVEPVAVEPVAVEPVAVEPVAVEPVEVEPASDEAQWGTLLPVEAPPEPSAELPAAQRPTIPLVVADDTSVEAPQQAAAAPRGGLEALIAAGALSSGPTLVVSLDELDLAETVDPVAEELPPTPSDERELWALTANMLVAEAALRGDASERAALLTEAARVTRTRLGDAAAAEQHARAAVEAAPGDLGARRELVESLNRNQRIEQLGAQMEALADLEPDAATATEVLQDAAVLARSHLRRDDEARRLLRRSVERNPRDLFSWQLLRDVYLAGRDWVGLAESLQAMAGLTDGPVAARLLTERGRVLAEELHQHAEATHTLALALEADPAHSPAFLALERLHIRQAEWGALAALYRAEAERVGGVDGAAWCARAARTLRWRVFDEEGALLALERALELAPSAALRAEQRSLLAALGRWPELAAALGADAQSGQGAAAAAAWLELARVHELAGSPEQALACARAAAAADPAAVTAADCAERLLARLGDVEGLLALLVAQAEAAQEPNAQLAAQQRVGDLLEGVLGRAEEAAAWYHRALELAPTYLPALDGLERVYAGLGRWEDLRALLAQRAELAPDPRAAADALARAALTGPLVAAGEGAPEQVLTLLRQALEHDPAHALALEACARLLAEAGNWTELTQLLRAAAEASEDAESQVMMLFRAARVHAERLGERTEAADALRRCLALSPGFQAAEALYKRLLGEEQDWAALLVLERAQAEAAEDPIEAAWRFLAARDLAQAGGVADPTAAQAAAELLAEAQRRAPAHPAVQRAAAQQALDANDLRAQQDELRAQAVSATEDAARAGACAALADLAREAGDALAAVQAASEVIAAEGVASRPLQALARLVEGLGHPEHALRAWQQLGVLPEVARLQEEQLDAPAEARELWLGAAADGDLAGAWALTRLQRRLQDREGLAAAHLRVAQLAASPALQVVHATLAGHFYAGLGQTDAAREAYALAYAARPIVGKALDGLRRLLVAAQDVPALTEAWSRLATRDVLALAGDLEDAGAPGEAADALAAVPGLAALLRRERALEAAGRWSEAMGALRALLPLLQDPAQRRAIESRQRWMLAEKLADSEEAWDLYRQLHEDRPDDRSVLEALSRIANARGDAAQAIRYTEHLAATSDNPVEAARLLRQVARFHQDQGDADAARQAWLSALGHQPEDREALAGLRQLVEQARDWSALVSVIAREASISEGADRVRAYVEIARIWQDELGRPDVASDAWRQVLELESGNSLALERLVGLCEGAEDWAGYADYGLALSTHREGAERNALLRRVGLVLLERLRDEDRALRVLESAIAGDHPDLEAAQVVERIRSGRGEWDRVAQVLRREARAQEGADAAATLARAARIYLDVQQDRESCAKVYEELLERFPGNLDALRFLSEHRFQAGAFEAAAALYEAMEGGIRVQDVDDFDEKVEVSLYFFHFATALFKLNRTSDAVRRLRQALELNPTHLPSLRLIGPPLLAEHAWEEAENVFQRILQLTGGTAQNDELGQTYVGLGEVELALGKLDKARKRFDKALSLVPNDVRALKGVAAVLYAQGDWSTVCNYYNNIIYHAKEPADVVEYYLLKSHVLDARMNMPDKAAQHYQKVLAFDPRQAVALMRLAELALRRREWDEALSQVESGLGLAEDPALRARLLLIRAIALRACGDNGAATQAWEEALGLDESLAESLAELQIDAYEQVQQTLERLLKAER